VPDSDTPRPLCGNGYTTNVGSVWVEGTEGTSGYWTEPVCYLQQNIFEAESNTCETISGRATFDYGRSKILSIRMFVDGIQVAKRLTVDTKVDTGFSKAGFDAGTHIVMVRGYVDVNYAPRQYWEDSMEVTVESCFITPDPDPSTEAETDCDGVYEENFLAYWIGGIGGGYGEPVLQDGSYIHLWTESKVDEVWGEYSEPLNCRQSEQCGRCSTQVTSTYVTWFDRDGGCDDDYNNERVEYPYHKDCYQLCSETVAKDKDWGVWLFDGPAVWNAWVDNGDGTFTKTGTRPIAKDWTQDFVDKYNEEHVCKTEDGTIYANSPLEETKKGSVEVYTNATCKKAWAHYEYFDPDGVFVSKDPNVRFFWEKPFELESATLLGVLISEPDKCLPEPEVCGRCSTQFVGWVTWVDRGGDCSGDYYNERVEYPYDARCYDSCQVGNTEEVQTSDSGWYDTGIPYGFGPWYANPLPPNFQHEGSQDQLRDYAGNVVDVNSEVFCEPYTDQDSQTIPYFEDEIAGKDPKVVTRSNCTRAWAWVRYFDPDGNKFVNGPKIYAPWVLSVYEPESVEIMGKTIHKKDKCLVDIPEEPFCPSGNPTITPATFNYETGEWEGLVCSPCRAVPVIEYIIQGEVFPCKLYGNAADGDSIWKLPTDVIWMMNNGVCDLKPLPCIPGREELKPFVRNESGQFSGKKVTTCYEVEPCIDCDGELVYPMDPLNVLR